MKIICPFPTANFQSRKEAVKVLRQIAVSFPTLTYLTFRNIPKC